MKTFILVLVLLVLAVVLLVSSCSLDTMPGPRVSSEAAPLRDGNGYLFDPIAPEVSDFDATATLAVKIAATFTVGDVPDGSFAVRPYKGGVLGMSNAVNWGVWWVRGSVVRTPAEGKQCWANDDGTLTAVQEWTPWQCEWSNFTCQSAVDNGSTLDRPAGFNIRGPKISLYVYCNVSNRTTRRVPGSEVWIDQGPNWSPRYFQSTPGSWDGTYPCPSGDCAQ